jgi:glycosyltransferase involved in cell wall biosynthesis
VFGWEPVVLTVKNGSYPSTDDSLEKDIPEGIKVYKTKTFEPFQLYNALKGKKGKSTGVGMIGMQEPSFFQRMSMYVRANYFIPDARKGWKKYAVKAAAEIIQEEGIEAVITTGPPHSAHLIGLDLKKRFSLPWIADLRDPWTTVFYNAFFPRTEKSIAKDQRLEDLVLTEADALTVVSNGMKQEFSDRNDDISIIYNGFDEDDMPPVSVQRSDRFTLSYVGNFKPNQNAPQLWEALAELGKEEESFLTDFRLFLTGNVDPTVLSSIEEAGLAQSLELSPFVAHKEAVRRMMSADMLLFVIPQSDRNKLIITGKLFEYLATGNAILAVGPVDGDASAVLADAGRSAMSDYSEKEQIKAQVAAAYKRWKAGESNRVEKGELARFSRRGLTEQLAHKLNELTA